MRGRIGKGKCHVPGHGHAHMRGAPPGYRCEVAAEVGTLCRTDEKRDAKRQISEEAQEKELGGFKCRDPHCHKSALVDSYYCEEHDQWLNP